MLHVEADPRDYARMGTLWHYYYESGLLQKTLGITTKVLVVPRRPDSGMVNNIQRHCRFHVINNAKLEFMNMKWIVQLNKKVEIAMEDGGRPPKKFTCLRDEFLDLRTSEDKPVVRNIIIRKRGINADTADVTFMAKNKESEALLRKISKHPPFWF